MTATLSPELYTGSSDTDLSTERLGGNPAALAVWDTLIPLLNGSERAQRFSDIVPVTPLLRVPEEALPPDLQDSGHRLYLAADGYMPTGEYKLRGVGNALLERLAADNELHRTVAASTGNHAAAVALASVLLGLDSVIYVPDDTVPAKIENTVQYGAQVLFKRNLELAVQEAEEQGMQDGSVFIHPYDRLAVVGGQGTLAANLPQQLALHNIDLNSQSVSLYEPAGGGGVATGNSVAAKALLPGVQLHIVQAENADALLAQLERREFNNAAFNTAVDGAAVKNPGNIARMVLSSPGFVYGRHVVTRAQIGEAMAITSRFTDIYEPAGAMALAGTIADMRRDPFGESVKIAHGTGINTTPNKTHEFANYAYRGELLTASEAFALTSMANINRRRQLTEVETQALALAALKQKMTPINRRTRIASGV